MAIRTTLGAGRSALVRQLVTESVLLSLVGGGLGLLGARVGVRALLLIGQSRLPRLDRVPFDYRVVIFTVALTTVTGIVVGLVPALRLLVTDTASLMNEGG